MAKSKPAATPATTASTLPLFFKRPAVISKDRHAGAQLAHIRPHCAFCVTYTGVGRPSICKLGLTAMMQGENTVSILIWPAMDDVWMRRWILYGTKPVAHWC